MSGWPTGNAEVAWHLRMAPFASFGIGAAYRDPAGSGARCFVRVREHGIVWHVARLRAVLSDLRIYALREWVRPDLFAAALAREAGAMRCDECWRHAVYADLQADSHEHVCRWCRP